MIPTINLTNFCLLFLNIFEASIPTKYKSIGKLKNDWITQGIKNLAGTRVTKIQEHFTLYIKYCKILNNVVK
jgi:hypothetical protein